MKLVSTFPKRHHDLPFIEINMPHLSTKFCKEASLEMTLFVDCTDSEFQIVRPKDDGATEYNLMEDEAQLFIENFAQERTRRKVNHQS